MTISSVSAARKMGGSSVDHIHDQMDSDPHYPFNLVSSWLPHPSSNSMRLFLDQVLNTEPTEYQPSVQAMDDLLSDNPVLTYLIEDACKQNGNIHVSDLAAAEAVNFPRIASKGELLQAFNTLLTQTPQFIDNELVGLPFSALVVGIDPTQSGMTLFRLPMFNEKMSDILNEWNTYLGSSASNWVFGTEGEQWLSSAAKKSYQFEVWQKDSETLPYWTSWNSFFTRQFKDKDASRPVAAADSNRIVVSANDGSLFRWDENIAAQDVFWFKDMLYSLSDILSSELPDQQKIIDDHKLIDLFTDGSIFQTYLNPYNFHRWWCPVNGQVLFDPLAVPGYFFNKLVIPDFAGATTASLPYLAQVNARGIMVIKTPDYGYVCCIPLGMSEVSSIVFDAAMTGNPQVSKGQEMGKFEYGGSSFALIFQKIPGKRLIFQNAAGDVYQKQPVLPKGSASTGGNITLIGSQIGQWQDVVHDIAADLPWQSIGYVNEGDAYALKYVGNLWTANPGIDDGNLYDANGSSLTATQPAYAMVGAPEGALIGRIGTNPPFLVGDGAITPKGQTGLLQLVINDDLAGKYGAGLTDNEGQVSVAVTPAG